MEEIAEAWGFAGKYSGTDVTIDGKDYLIVRESDVLAIL